MAKKVQTRFMALISGVIFVLVFSLSVSSESYLGQLLFGTESSTVFTIQNLMWLMFFIGLGELYLRHYDSKEDIEAFKKGYLIEEVGIFYDQKALMEVMTNVHDKKNRLAHLIQVLYMRYQASNKSTNETHEMLNSQLEMMQFKLDVDYNMIRYISWLIPTLGFIGTVVGISKALAYAGIPGEAEKANFLSTLTTELAVAFNTTLLALIMSAVIVYIMHIIQGREESVIQQCGEYCLNNFINKLMSK